MDPVVAVSLLLKGYSQLSNVILFTDVLFAFIRLAERRRAINVS